jgi:hypothetical protein
MDEQNPYREDLNEIQRVNESDPDSAARLVVALRRKIERDIEEQRRDFHTTFAQRLVGATPSRMQRLLKELLAKWIDIPARLYLYRFEDFKDPQPYCEVLEYLDKREGPIWELFPPEFGGDLAVQVIVDGRKSHWKVKAIRQAKLAAARNVATQDRPEDGISDSLSTTPSTDREPASALFRGQDKGNLDLLRTDGKLKDAVTLETACRFGGVSRRAIEKAIKRGSLKASGSYQNRRITVDSLLKYFPPENNTN